MAECPTITAKLGVDEWLETTSDTVFRKAKL
jgi:hypothetical protein